MPIGMASSKAVSADSCLGERFLVLNIQLEGTTYQEGKRFQKMKPKYSNILSNYWKVTSSSLRSLKLKFVANPFYRSDTINI